MTELDVYENQKLTIEKIRDSLQAVPIIYGSVIMDYLYRKYDTKDKLVNYCEISFSLTNSEHFHNCRTDTLRGMIDVYSTNEILTQKLAYALSEKINNSQVTPTLYIQQCEVDGSSYMLDKNKYVCRITFKLVM